MRQRYWAVFMAAALIAVKIGVPNDGPVALLQKTYAGYEDPYKLKRKYKADPRIRRELLTSHRDRPTLVEEGGF